METMTDPAGAIRLLPTWGTAHGADYQPLQTETGGPSDRLCQAEGLRSLGFVCTTKLTRLATGEAFSRRSRAFNENSPHSEWFTATNEARSNAVSQGQLIVPLSRHWRASHWSTVAPVRRDEAGQFSGVRAAGWNCAGSTSAP